MNIETVFELVRYAVDEKCALPDLSDVDWEEFSTFSKQQAITGVMFDLVQRLGGKEVGVPRQLLLNWYMQVEKIQKRNELVDKCAVKLTQQLEQKGFRSCLLKGQGNAVMYPRPSARVPGDIDLIVIPDNLSGRPKDEAARRNAIMAFVKKVHPQAELRYQHVDLPIIKGVPVELHFIPCIVNNPLYHRRMQKWFGERMDDQCQNKVELPNGVGSVPAPTIEFNVVYQLAHMMHHFFDEGIGLRQMMDYYYLLKSAEKESRIIELKNISSTLHYLNLYHFAGAVMYVMREAFGMSEDKMIVPVDERRGKTLMQEILRGGNFGQHSGLTKHGTATKYLLKNWRSLRLVMEYPGEALAEPLFRTWHFFWRAKNK